MATPTSAATPSSTYFSPYASCSAPVSRRESPEGSPQPESPKEEEKEGYGEQKVGEGYLIPLKTKGSLNLSSICLDPTGKQPPRRLPRHPSRLNLDLFKFRRGLPPRGRLHPDLFIDPSPEENEEDLSWVLQAQDQILSSQRDKTSVQRLINTYKEIPNHAESHRLYVHLHVFTTEQRKTEEVFLQHMQRFPKDVLIWKIFVTFLKKAPDNEIYFRYDPQEIIALLNHPNLKMLHDLSWVQETLKALPRTTPNLVRKISPTLKKCVELSQGHLDAWAQWTLKAEDALTRCYSRIVQPGKTPFVLSIPLTPRRKEGLLNPLIRQFENPPPLPVEIHRLHLRLRLLASDKIEALIAQYRKSFPKDYLAEYYILSSMRNHKEFRSVLNRCIEIIPNFPYLLWIQEMIGKVFPPKEEQKK